jgi:rhodanese-related sulfurtransferase
MRPPVSLNFEPGTLNIRAHSLLGPQCVVPFSRSMNSTGSIVAFSESISRTEPWMGQAKSKKGMIFTMPNQISCRDLAALMASETLHAVFDVRERGEFNFSQISNATSLPRSQIEFRIAELVPDRRIPIVVYDEGEGRAVLAAHTLGEFGYETVSILDGGLPEWRMEELPTVSGVNVPSKAFGEKVHHERNIPEISPEELKSLQKRVANLMIFDVRTPEEYGRFCIPGGVNVPGGDLILWAEALRRKPETTVVVNCAGRTRSIIGTAALLRLGLNNVHALKNGTMGWVLTGLELESAPARTAPTAPHQSRKHAREIALRIAEEEKLSWVSARELLDHRARNDLGVTYLIDVRSEGEYEEGHIAGSLNIPGGQAVQRADDFVAVKNARIIFVSNQSARAVMAAYWYGQMGFPDVRVLQGGLEAWREGGGAVKSGGSQKELLGFEAAKKLARLLAPDQVNSLLQTSSVSVLDVGSSLDFAAAHLAGSKWISRGWLELKLPSLWTDKAQPIVLSCHDGQSSILAARTLADMGYNEIFVLDGGVQMWTRAGYPTERGLESCLVEPNDVVLSPSVKGDKEAMRRYLEWEVKLTQ